MALVFLKYLLDNIFLIQILFLYLLYNKNKLIMKNETVSQYNRIKKAQARWNRENPEKQMNFATFLDKYEKTNSRFKR